MKLMIVLSCLAITQIMASEAYSQTTKMTLQLKDVKVKEVLNQIENNSDFFFLYNSKLVDVDRKVSADYNNEKIKDILGDLFNGTDVVYAVVDKQIVLTNKANQNSLEQMGSQQVQKVSGSVVDKNGEALPGVNVVVTGTTRGIITDADGKFTIEIPAGGKSLTFSFVGYTSQEVTIGNKAVLDVTMEPASLQLGEVVVTALGVERNTKALQSSVTKVPGVSLTQAREINLGNSIQGRVAGVDVTKTDGGPAGSSRVIIRGNKSLGGSNQPLYVVDGIPMDNSNFGQAGIWGGTDNGDGLSSINPDDIESITVMKGASASALYGSRGGYGVINIITKRGTNRKGIGVELNTNNVFENAINLTDLQHEYGNGGLKPSDINDPSSEQVFSRPATRTEAFNWGGQSWGEKLDGAPTVQFDGVERPYKYTGDNWKRFYRTGLSSTNSIALTGGNEKQAFRFSFADLRSTSIIPNSGFYRKNVSLTTNGKFGKRLTFNAKVMYSNERTKNRPMISDSPGNVPQAIYRIPNNINVNDMKGDPDRLGCVPAGMETEDSKSTGEELAFQANTYLQNPWFTAYQFQRNSLRDRVITSGQLRYDITDWLYVQAKIGMDYYYRKASTVTPTGTSFKRGGDASESDDDVREVNQEWTMGFNKAFGKINVNAFVGGNKMTREGSSRYMGGDSFSIPFFYSVNNIANRSSSYGYSKWGTNSLFASAEVSYNSYLYITATARNDWFSVLNPKNNSKLYPSVGASFVFTEAFKNLPEAISFGKLRASWGQTATANLGAYAANLTYGVNSISHLQRPMAVFSNGGNIPNPELVPALSSEIEVGTELRFLKDRLGLDFTYYTQKTTDDILSATISEGSGYTSTSVNVGELTNKGFELLLTGTPVQGSVTWDVSLNLAKNRNEVVRLKPGMTEMGVEEPRTQTAMIKHIVGHPYGMITGLVQKTDAQGNRVYTSEGVPVQSDKYEILGNGVADVTGGLTNTFSYKNFNLSFLIDFKFGGDIYSGTNVRLLEWGLTKETLQGREGGFTVTGVTQTGTDGSGNPVYEPFTKTLNPQQTRSYWVNLGEVDEAHFIYDASFIKFRQLSFGYNFPTSMLNKTPFKTLSLSFIGRNLAILYKNVENIDPESSYQNGSGQGLDYFGMPTTRTYGFNLKVTF